MRIVIEAGEISRETAENAVDTLADLGVQREDMRIEGSEE